MQLIHESCTHQVNMTFVHLYVYIKILLLKKSETRLTAGVQNKIQTHTGKKKKKNGKKNYLKKITVILIGQ